MCIQTRVTVICSHCAVVISRSAGAFESCGKNVRGPLNEVDQNTDEVCDGVEIEDVEEEGGLCHNCTIMDEAERRSAERHAAEEEEEDMEEVPIPY